MSTGSAPIANSFGIAEVVGDASTAEELQACKIGGCCGKNTPRLSMDAVSTRMSALPDWVLSDDQKVISKSFVAKDWASAMAFFNILSKLAEDEGRKQDEIGPIAFAHAPGSHASLMPIFRIRSHVSCCSRLAQPTDHPDLHLTSWRNVRVDLSTHAIGGLSMPDLVLAAKIDAIPVEYSPKWLREKQAAAGAGAAVA